MIDKRVFSITTSDAGIRLDKWLAQAAVDLSRTRIASLIETQNVTVNGVCLRASYKVAVGDVIAVVLPKPRELTIVPESIELDIRYEDEWLLVVNKPQGMVVHPAPGHHQGTLVHALMGRFGSSLSNINGALRPGIIHRLDKDTSGLLVVVKDNEAHQKMAKQLANHDILRIYNALVWGTFAEETGTIDAPIGRDTNNRQRMAVVPHGGKEARTHFSVSERFPKTTLLRCELETGRTHQIRVHLAMIGHSVVGDPVYAPAKKSLDLKGQALHAAELRFTHPITSESITVTAPLPQWFDTLLEKQRENQV